MAELNIFGTKHIAGGTFKDISVLGVLNADGDVHTDDLSVLGKAYFESNVFSNDVDIVGLAEIKGNLRCQNVDIIGKATINGNVDSTKLEVVGKATVLGDVNVDQAEIVAVGSSFNNIYGDTIKFKSNPKYKGVTINSDDPVTANEIDATNITLKNIKVKKVSGENIKILDNVEVELVEYSKSLSISRDAKIGKIVKF